MGDRMGVTGPPPAPGTFPRHNWLPAVVPVDARRFLVTDRELGMTLADAGAELVDERADVEIVRSESGLGEAGFVAITVDATSHEGGSRLRNVASRVVGSAQVKARALRTARRLRRASYRDVRVIPYEWEQVVRLPAYESPAHDVSFAEWFPRSAVVVGKRNGSGPTVLEAAAEEAGRTAGRPVRLSWPLLRQGGLVVLAPELVLRVAMGPARRELERGRAVLAALDESGPPPSVKRRVPRPLEAGRVGLADWLLEERLPGSTPPLDMSDRLLGECVDFLVDLHLSGRKTDGEPVGLEDHARVIASSAPRFADELAELGGQLERDLADLPRGFGHADFWRRNLLAEDGRLTGVVDWHGAGSTRLPLIDLMHLRLSAVFERRRQFLGSALVQSLLPWARAGGDDVARTYCERVGLPVTPSRLEDLALAYWLSRTAGELETYADRAGRPVWMRHNVHEVAEALFAARAGADSA